MGTDIHLYVEHMNSSGQWELPTEPNPYYDGDYEARLAKARTFKHYPQPTFSGFSSLFDKGDPKPDPVPYTEEEAAALAKDPEQWDLNLTRPTEGYSGRNYNLFAILANLRNGRGFAGVLTGEPTVPIDAPRGVPDDASLAYRNEVDNWGTDGHSHSWFSLHELLAYDWDGHDAINSLMMHPSGAFGPEKPPENFDFDAWAIEIELVLNVQGEAAAYERWPSLGMCGGISGPGAHEWRRITWRQSHREQAGTDWFEFLDSIKELADDPYKIRVVFFFDN